MLFGGGAETYRPTCPHCNTEASGVRMDQCLNPDCRKYFVTEAMKNNTGGLGGVGPAKKICTYCQADQVELIRKHAQEYRRRRGR